MIEYKRNGKAVEAHDKEGESVLTLTPADVSNGDMIALGTSGGDQLYLDAHDLITLGAKLLTLGKRMQGSMEVADALLVVHTG